MRIAIDAMSGDLGSAPVVEACRHFANEHKDATLVVVGKQEELESLKDLENVEIVDARDVVKMTDSVMSVRRKKESSLVKALMMARNDEVDGVVSCGSTGAYYTAAMLFVKRIEGVSKSCLMATLPTFNGQGTCLLDVGANAENTAEQLGDFAIMGSLYCKNVRDIGNPKVALLNIGAEPHKGDEMHQEEGDADVIVTDGFSGNIALKSTEGAALIVMKAVKEGLMSSTRGKIGALIAKPAIYSVKDKFPLYLCDPIKNTECSKTSCKFVQNIGECTNTTKKEFAKIDEHGEPIIAYTNMEEVMAEFNALEHTSSGLIDD